MGCWLRGEAGSTDRNCTIIPDGHESASFIGGPFEEHTTTTHCRYAT
jgi:hypothetical protein